VDLHGIGRLGLLGALALGDELGDESTLRLLCIGGRSRDVGGCRRGIWHLLEAQQLDLEHQHARRRAELTFVGERLGDPEATLLALGHQLHALGPAGDDAVQWKGSGRGGLTRHARDEGAVEHLPVGRPAGVVDRHFVPRSRMFTARAGREHLGSEAAGRLLGVRRSRRHVGRRGDGGRLFHQLGRFFGGSVGLSRGIGLARKLRFARLALTSRQQECERN
jgi:hypothetical protein